MTYRFKFNEDTFCEDVMNYANRYRRTFERFYHNDYQDDKLHSKTTLHSIYTYTLNLSQQPKKESGCSIKEIHRQLKLLKNENIPDNYDYFTSILKEMDAKTIQDVLIHDCKGKPKYKSRKFNPLLIDYLDVLFAKNPLKKYRQFHEMLLEKAQIENWWGPPSIHFIKRYLSDKKKQIELRVVRNGESYFGKTISKQMHFSLPEFAGQLFEIDGSRLQIPYNNTIKKRIDFLTVFIILDVTSSNVLGYAHGPFESSVVVVNAFKRYFKTYSFLPVQITRDGSSAFKKDFIFMEEFMAKRGVKWVVTHNPQGKPHIENFYKIFASSICSYHQAFIGLGITSSHIDSRITDKKKLRKKVGDRNNLSTYEELVFDLDLLISKYSNMIFNGCESAQMKFDRKFESTQVTTLLEADKTAMCGTYKSLTVSNCEVTVTHNSQSHFYQIPGIDGESINEVFVAYNTENLDKIHLYKDHFQYWQTVNEYEVIPFLASQRTSSQQERYIKELSSRKSRYQQLIKNVKDKEKRVEEASSNNPNFEVIRIHRNKEDEANAQNEFTRSLLGSENSNHEDHDDVFYPPTIEEPKAPQDFRIERFKKI
ncbi:MAG: hypothetical protein NXI20_03385 [bacterium]|nr:hypothetical protein [bacterium]